MDTETKNRAERLAKENSKVDLERVTEALKAVDELRSEGIPGPKYRLASPYGRTVVHSADESTWTS